MITMDALFVAWSIFWAIHLYFSQKYLYRAHDERPLLFSKIKKTLWIVQLIIALVLIGDLALNRSSLFLGLIVLLIAFAAPLVIKRAAYARALRMQQRSLSKYGMPEEHAGVVARMLLDLRPE